MAVVLPRSSAGAEGVASALPEIAEGLHPCGVGEWMFTRPAGLFLCRPWVTGRLGGALSDPMDRVMECVRPGEALVDRIDLAVARSVGGIVRDCGSVAVGHDRLDRDAGEDHPRDADRGDEERQQDGEEQAVRPVARGRWRGSPGGRQTPRERRDGSSLPFCLPTSVLSLCPMVSAAVDRQCSPGRDCGGKGFSGTFGAPLEGLR